MKGDSNRLIILILCLINHGCYQLQDPTVIVSANEVIKLAIVDANLESGNDTLKTMRADSTSSRLIIITLESESDPAQSVTVKTTAGVLTLAGESPSANSVKSLTVTPVDREIIVQLNSLDIPDEEVIVSGSIGTISNVVTFVFEPSFVHDFQILPIAASPAKEDTLTVNVEAVAQSGVVSENVFFSVDVNAPDSIPVQFPALIKLVNQKASFKVVNIENKTGEIEISIKMPTSRVDSIENKLQVKYL